MSDEMVEARGEKLAAKHVRDMGNRARTVPRDASFKVRSIFRKSEEERFKSSGHGTWAPIKDATREHKTDPRILRATGALYKSLTAPRANAQVDERTPDSMRFGTTVPYAVFHDTGKGQAKRKLIDLTPAERRDITAALEKYLATGQADKTY